MASNIFGLGEYASTPSLYENYGGTINTEGFGRNLPQTGLAGRGGLNIDPEELKQFKDAFGPDGALIYWSELNRRRESDPENLKKQLEILGPYQKDVARERQRLGMESNIFAGVMNLPNKWQEAMAQKFAFYQPTMDLLRGNATARAPFVTRQYINV
jgi:hypothetical protein